MKVERFEELKVWQRARELAVWVYQVTAGTTFDPDLKRQLRRAAGSVMHNIAEGFDAGSDREFARFLRLARRSASEVQSELYLACDLGMLKEAQRQHGHALAEEIRRMINSLIGYLKRSSP